MTANNPLKSEGGGEGGGGGGGGSHTPSDSKAFLKDLDSKLDAFDVEVESALQDSSFKGTSISHHSKEPEHFSIRGSPTRSIPLSELNKKDN